MSLYTRPTKKMHRTFFYLNDDEVVNSLSMFEAGKVDEVVSKAVITREGGAGVGLGLSGTPVTAKVDASRKGATTTEENIVRQRTRFSLFQAWEDALREQGGMGRFEGWSPSSLVDVSPGDTVEFQATLDFVPIFSLMKTFLWFAGQAEKPGNPFSQKGEALKATKEAARNMKWLLGSDDGETGYFVYATPVGDAGPAIAMLLKDRWMLDGARLTGGVYTVIAQVDQIINEDDFLPVLRVFPEGQMSTMERELIHEAIGGFTEPAKNFDVDVSRTDGEMHGPAAWINPVAIYR